VRLGGTTSIDVTKPGIDKAYGIGKLRVLLGISLEEMLFVGDALFVGGNDYPVKEAGVVSIAVRGPGETKPVTSAIIACLDRAPALAIGNAFPADLCSPMDQLAQSQAAPVGIPLGGIARLGETA